MTHDDMLQMIIRYNTLNMTDQCDAVLWALFTLALVAFMIRVLVYVHYDQ